MAKFGNSVYCLMVGFLWGVGIISSQVFLNCFFKQKLSAIDANRTTESSEKSCHKVHWMKVWKRWASAIPWPSTLKIRISHFSQFSHQSSPSNPLRLQIIVYYVGCLDKPSYLISIERYIWMSFTQGRKLAYLCVWMRFAMPVLD